MDTKYCTYCKEEHPRGPDYWSRAGKGECRIRRKDRAAAWRKKHPEAKKEWDIANEEHAYKYRQDRYWSDPEKARQATLDWQKKNPDIVRRMKESWLDRNPDWHSKYVNLNRGKINSYAASYRAKKLKATPLWADLSAIQAFYEACPPGYHVDHIIPLQGKIVSGLHVLNNLQYLPAHENLSKSNKFDPETLRP